VPSNSSSTSALAELLASERELLLECWAARAGRFALRAAAPRLLRELERALASGRARPELGELVDQIGSDNQAVRELMILRAVVLELVAERNLRVEPGESALLHRAIDDVLLAFSERALQQQAAELALRERFVRVLGHDLRNPIAAIKLGSSMLARDVQPAEARRRTAERILSSSNRMLRMLEDLLDFMRLRPGALPALEVGSGSLNVLCREVVDESLAAHPQRVITFDADAEVTGTFDRRRLSHALGNVISAALEHSPADSDVRVVLSGDGPCISVRHHGPVISQAELDTIFDPLRRTDLGKSGERPARGLGLGLFLADQIVRAHGGQILAESSGEAGTTFRLLLPSLAKD